MTEFILVLGLLFGGIAILALVLLNAPTAPSRIAIPTPPRRHHQVRQTAAQPAIDATWVVGRPAHLLKRDAK